MKTPKPFDAIGYQIDMSERLSALEKQNTVLLEALKEIAKGEGDFSVDRLTHAENVIEKSMNLASEAIKTYQAQSEN